MTTSELLNALKGISQTFPTAQVVVEGWNDSGDLQVIRLRGDLRLERDANNMPVIVIR